MTSKSCENPLLNNLCARLRTWLTLQDGNQFIHAVLVAQNLEQNRVRNMGYVCDMWVPILGFGISWDDVTGPTTSWFFSGKLTNTKRTLLRINCPSTIHEHTHINIEICL